MRNLLSNILSPFVSNTNVKLLDSTFVCLWRIPAENIFGVTFKNQPFGILIIFIKRLGFNLENELVGKCKIPNKF
jgi:hypothetical protein